MSQTNGNKLLYHLIPKLREHFVLRRDLDQGSTDTGQTPRPENPQRDDGTVVAEPGDLVGTLTDALEDGDRSTIKLVSGETYRVDGTAPIPPNTILEGQGARIEPTSNVPILRPWPTARVRDVFLDWSDYSSFDSEGVLFRNDSALYDPDIPKPWDEDTFGPVRAWAHGRFGSHYHELENISVAGNRQGRAVSAVNTGEPRSGMHFINGRGIQVERVDTAVHVAREAGAFQNNSHTWEVHAEDCRVGVHHEHDSDNNDRSLINGNQYRMSWQPDASQSFSETVWHNEEGKSNIMYEWPVLWDFGRHVEDSDAFIFESPFPDLHDWQRSGGNIVVGRVNRVSHFRDEVTGLTHSHNRNRSVAYNSMGHTA